jgi:prepilin-type N-terminal cleavage/methylation domain-containing protein
MITFVKRHVRPGFTLLELVAAVTIMAILAGAGLYTGKQIRDRTHDEAAAASLLNVARQIQALARTRGGQALADDDFTRTGDDLNIAVSGSGNLAAGNVTLRKYDSTAESAAHRNTLPVVISFGYSSPGPAAVTAGLAAVSGAEHCVGVQLTATTAGVVDMRNADIDAGECNGANAATGTVTETPAEGGATPALTAPVLSGAAGDGQVTLAWTDVPGAAGYRLNRDGAVTTVFTGSAGGPQQITGLVNGQVYRFTVAAVMSATVTGPESNTVTLTPSGAPATPQNLTAAAGDTTVSLTWRPVESTPAAAVTGYRVYRDGVQIDAVGGPALTDTGLTNGRTYSYTVTAYGPGGESAQSSPATATPTGPAGGDVDGDGGSTPVGDPGNEPGAGTPPPATAPAAPVRLTGYAGDRANHLSWQPVNDTAVTGYELFQDGSSVWTGPGTSHTVTGLTNGTEYRYTVRAVAGVLTSGDSDEVRLTPHGPPARVTGLTGTGGDQLADLTWNTAADTAAAPLTGYRLFLDGTQVWTGTATTARVTGLTNGVAYTFTVKGYGPGGEATESAPAVVVPAGPGTFHVVGQSYGFLPASATDPGQLPGREVTAVTGYNHICALTGGQVYCRGDNQYGQLGVGTVTTHYDPTWYRVQGLLAGRTVTAVAAGTQTTCAVADGAAYCWGNNNQGQLGTGTTTKSTVPAAVSTGAGSALAGRTVTAIAVGNSHVCAVASGQVACWGTNGQGQLGTGTTTGSTVPVAVTGLPAGVTAVGAGELFTCAIASAAVYCWGLGSSGQVGNGTTSARVTAPSRVDTTTGLGSAAVSSLSVGTAHACVIASGRVFCWGSDYLGQLGNGVKGTAGNQTRPYDVSTGSGMAGRTASAVSAGMYHTCALAGGTGWCWGNNSAGQLVTPAGDAAERLTPNPITVTGPLSGKALQSLTAGNGTTAAVAR